MSAYLHHIKQAIPAGLLTGMMAAGQAASAQDMTAGIVLERMETVELNAYLSGIVEGLAYARYQRDGQNAEGMGCIYRWYYEGGDDMILEIYATFARFPDHLPGAVMAAMTQKACGA